MYAVLIVLQLVFLAGLVPTTCLLPAWVAVRLVAVCLGVNHLLRMLLLNGMGGAIGYHSRLEYAPALPERAHEQ